MLRQRIVDAVAQHQVLPPWLTKTLGHTPLERHHDQWVDLATDILKLADIGGELDACRAPIE